MSSEMRRRINQFVSHLQMARAAKARGESAMPPPSTSILNSVAGLTGRAATQCAAEDHASEGLKEQSCAKASKPEDFKVISGLLADQATAAGEAAVRED